MEITGHTVDIIEDPFAILSGKRYEFFVYIQVPEDDELFSELGLKIKVLFVVDDGGSRTSHYHIIEQTTEKILDFELDEDEETILEEYCKQNIPNE